MNNIKYKIEFFSNWHCGSGLAAGADVDLLVVKDSNNLPIIPGKTIKGLVREACELLIQLNDNNMLEAFQKCFGYFDDKDNHMRGTVFFTNAELEENNRNAIIKHGLSRHLYSEVASTAIGEDGVAENMSLRKMEIVIPCTLAGEIKNVDSDLSDLVCNALKMIKHIGVNRSRGLGRCSITLINEEG